MNLAPTMINVYMQSELTGKALSYPTVLIALPHPGVTISFQDDHPFAIVHQENNFVCTNVIILADEPVAIITVVPLPEFIQATKSN